jgi:hypothetical protein
MLKLTDIYPRDGITPPIICANCGFGPEEHNVVGSPERLACRKPNIGEWAYTKERKAWDISKQLERLEKKKTKLQAQLGELQGARG